MRMISITSVAVRCEVIFSPYANDQILEFADPSSCTSRDNFLAFIAAGLYKWIYLLTVYYFTYVLFYVSLSVYCLLLAVRFSLLCSRSSLFSVCRSGLAQLFSV